MKKKINKKGATALAILSFGFIANIVAIIKAIELNQVNVIYVLMQIGYFVSLYLAFELTHEYYGNKKEK